MPAPVFIGDEVTAAGYRLAGARTLITDAHSAGERFADAMDKAEIVFITADCASAIEPERLAAALRRAAPLVLVVPDAAGSVPPDAGGAVDHVLGIES